jgi:membrane-associated phospholipid phosphatase
LTRFECLFALMIKPWVVVCYVGLIVLSFFYLDRPIALYFHDLDPRTAVPFLNWFTQMGLGALYLVPLLLIALYFRYIHPNRDWEIRAWFLWLCVLVPSLLCLVLKITLGRARPDLLFSDQLYGFYGFQFHAPFWSFPSGHTTTIMGFVFGLCVVFSRYFYAFILFGLLAISSRIMLTHHYFSDVLAASFLSLLAVGLVTWCFIHKNLLTEGRVSR